MKVDKSLTGVLSVMHRRSKVICLPLHQNITSALWRSDSSTQDKNSLRILGSFCNLWANRGVYFYIPSPHDSDTVKRSKPVSMSLSWQRSRMPAENLQQWLSWLSALLPCSPQANTQICIPPCWRAKDGKSQNKRDYGWMKRRRNLCAEQIKRNMKITCLMRKSGTFPH